jgi:epoxide hydrolase-like predicted phosphatase
MIKAVFFDVGGVLIIRNDKRATLRWANKIGIRLDDLEGLVFHGDIAREALIGRLSNGDQWKHLGKRFRLNDREITQMEKDFLMKGEENERLVSYVSRLRKAKFKTAILSNDNSDARRLWRRKYSFLKLFDAVIVSAEIGIMKPDPRIFMLAADRLNVLPNEAVVVDNSKENVDTALSVGMVAVHYRNVSTTVTALRRLTGVY